MPLSRLAPRSSRTGLTSKGKKPTQNGDTQRHLHLWTAIRKTREEIDAWQRQVDQVESLFSVHVAPREYKLTNAVSDITEKLMDCFSVSELDIPDQSLLGLWICDNISSLVDHPFGDKQRVDVLRSHWAALLNNDGPVENQLARLNRNYSDSDENLNANTEDQQDIGDDSYADNRHEEELASESAQQVHESSSTRSNTTHKKKQKKKQPDASEHTQTDSPDIAETISTLEDKLSVERLFRQLAKVLHPDREQDEVEKEKKHVLMSQLLEARKGNDINALLNLYCEHIGELPDDIDVNSHNELIAALEQQLKELQLELRQKRFADPLQSMIVERYSSSNAADCEQRINNHAKSLDIEIDAASALLLSLSTVDGLLDALDERRAVEQDKLAINELTGY